MIRRQRQTVGGVSFDLLQQRRHCRKLGRRRGERKHAPSGEYFFQYQGSAQFPTKVYDEGVEPGRGLATKMSRLPCGARQLRYPAAWKGCATSHAFQRPDGGTVKKMRPVCPVT